MEIRDRVTSEYVSDLARREVKVREVVFGWSLAELYALESWVPRYDSFHKEVVDAINELEALLEEAQDE